MLGIGGERMLRALGFEIATYHLNEGHAALLTLALLRRYRATPMQAEGGFAYDLAPVRERCVFTTHTPVEAGHDRFPYELVEAPVGRFHRDRPAAASRRRGRAQHDAAGAQSQRLGQRRGGAPRRDRRARCSPATRSTPSPTACMRRPGRIRPSTRLFRRHVAAWAHEPEMLSAPTGCPSQASGRAHAEAKAALLAR